MDGTPPLPLDLRLTAASSVSGTDAVGPYRRLPRLQFSHWSLQIGEGHEGRPTLKVYTRNDALADVSTASPHGALLLGARRGIDEGRAWALAWGQIPPGADDVTVTFTSGLLSWWKAIAATRTIAGSFWVAELSGTFRSVAVEAGPVQARGLLHRTDHTPD